MNPLTKLLTALVVSLACTSAALAHHVVWLDFSDFDLSAWTTVNGNTPPSSNDVDAIKDLIIMEMSRDHSAFDVTFSEYEPPNGRFTRVKFMNDDEGGTLGCAGPGCCEGGDCSGIDTWEQENSDCEVYAGSFSNLSPELTGSSATLERIARAIAHTASHELGHVMGLQHCNAADDSITLGCGAAETDTDDDNVNWHIMASGTSWGLTAEQRAARDRFFSIHASKREWIADVQPRNHFLSLPNINGGAGWSDIVWGRALSHGTMEWWGRLSSSSDFGSRTQWRTDAGETDSIFLTGDVDGDNRDDLVYGRIKSATQVKWFVRLSTGTEYGPQTTWRDDAGDVGDIFRLADVDNDGRADLVYGRPLSPTVVKWYVRRSTGTSFDSWETWIEDAGANESIFFLTDLGGDGDADLLYGKALDDDTVKWWGRFAKGNEFGDLSVWREDAGNKGDTFFAEDIGGDGDADLIYGRTLSDIHVKWWGRYSNGSEFGTLFEMDFDAGSAGDLHRIGDGNGDGRADLFYGRNAGQDNLSGTPDLLQIKWYGRLGLGGTFDNWTIWREDSGDDGDMYP
ncbi:MAG: FG-GAP-like repeat-containing protein [Pseudomonadota bacterium]